MILPPFFRKRPEPDLPEGFGYKTACLALGTTDTLSVASALGLKKPRVSTWQAGIKAAYELSIFVTPPLDGWTLVVGRPLEPSDRPDNEIKPLVEQLSVRFGEAQYFATHRVVEFHVWARAMRGRLVRGFCYIGESGGTEWDEGAWTPEELALGFRFFDARSAEAKREGYWERTDLAFPTEDKVMRLAAAWSLDPSRLDGRFLVRGLGILGDAAGRPWVL